MNSGPCLDCVHKHLCQAMIIHEEELTLGYPEDKKRIIGHLAEATRHALLKHQQLAQLLREWRKRIREDKLNTLLPPYKWIIDFVEVLIVCEMNEMPFPELPADLNKSAHDPDAPDNATP